MFCLKCGSIIPGGAVYCPGCGLKAGAVPEAPKVAEPVTPAPPVQPVVPQPRPDMPQPQYTPAPTPPTAPPIQPVASQPNPVAPQSPPQYAQTPPAQTVATPPQPTQPTPPRPQPSQQYIPPQQARPQPVYVQQQYAPRLPQGPKARGRALLLTSSILLFFVAVISMILQGIYLAGGGSWIPFPTANFLSGLQLLQNTGIDFIYTWTIPFFIASIIVLGISIAGMPLAFSKISGGFFIITGIIFTVGQIIGFISPIIINTVYYDMPLNAAWGWMFTPTNIILTIIEIGLPVLYIVGGILNKRTPR